VLENGRLEAAAAALSVEKAEQASTLKLNPAP